MRVISPAMHSRQREVPQTTIQLMRGRGGCLRAAALLFAFAVAGCSSSGNHTTAGSPRPSVPTAVPPPLATPASAAFQISEVGGQSRAQRTSGALTVSKDTVTYISQSFATPEKSVELVFPISASDRCVTKATLELTLSEPSSGDPKVIAYPSALFGGHAISSSGSQLVEQDYLLDNSPQATGSIGLGIISFDVSSIYKLWLLGGPFPSQGNQVPPGTPFEVILRRPDDGVGDGWSAAFRGQATATGSEQPRLLITRDPACVE